MPSKCTECEGTGEQRITIYKDILINGICLKGMKIKTYWEACPACSGSGESHEIKKLDKKQLTIESNPGIM